MPRAKRKLISWATFGLSDIESLRVRLAIEARARAARAAAVLARAPTTT